MNKTEIAFGRLYEIIGRLRAPDGCPWDREQTPETMRSDLVEECFEAVDAINQKDAMHVKEELGDVILNASMISSLLIIFCFFDNLLNYVSFEMLK